MRRVRNSWRGGWIGTGLAFTLALAFVLAGPQLTPAWFWKEPVKAYATTPVLRTDLDLMVTAGGRVDSTDKTIISCELEAAIGSDWGSSSILSLVPEGTMVKKGDVLCTLDSARHEENVRLSEIVVSQARAGLTEAGLNLDVARIAVTEYRNGLVPMSLKTLNGQIVLARSDQERNRDRLHWSRRMLTKGYLSRSQVRTEESTAARIESDLKRSESALRVFETWTAPKRLRELEADVQKAISVFEFQTSRLGLYEKRLTFLRKQVEACTIRAPHDGFLVYYPYPEHRGFRIQEGAVVLKAQKLFYLPDLGRMEVVASLHESVVKDVRPGMTARVGVEGLPGREIEGRLDSVAMLPSQQWFNDVKHFSATIKLHDVPAGLRPGMTASVDLLDQKTDVLAIPNEAVIVENGEHVCYVESGGSVLRRGIKIGQSTRDLIEVTDGLEEGESVVLTPGLVPPEPQPDAGPGLGGMRPSR